MRPWLWVLVLASSTGCGGSSDEVKDPKSEMENEVNRLMQLAASDEACRAISGWAYDVQKTESLVSPFVGYVTCVDGFYEIRVSYAFQNERWVMKEAKARPQEKARKLLARSISNIDEWLEEPSDKTDRSAAFRFLGLIRQARK